MTPGKSDDYYTPQRFLELGRRWCGGDFTLDPASTERANRLVRADMIFTAAENGLDQPWSATPIPWRWWVNPPFSVARLFAQKVLVEHERAPAARIAVLMNAKTEAAWWQSMCSAATHTLLARGRPVFLDGPRCERMGVIDFDEADEKSLLVRGEKGHISGGRSGVSVFLFGAAMADHPSVYAAPLGLHGVWL